MSPDVIIDTNVFVAAGFNSRSASGRILQQVDSGGLRMIWNEATRGEIEHVIGKIPALSGRISRTLFREEGFFPGKTYPGHFDYVRDPSDRKFAALADASGATLISNDVHLLEGREMAKVPVLTPGEFCDRDTG